MAPWVHGKLLHALDKRQVAPQDSPITAIVTMYTMVYVMVWFSNGYSDYMVTMVDIP
jgi:hypothetical protein